MNRRVDRPKFGCFFHYIHQPSRRRKIMDNRVRWCDQSLLNFDIIEKRANEIRDRLASFSAVVLSKESACALMYHKITDQHVSLFRVDNTVGVASQLKHSYICCILKYQVIPKNKQSIKFLSLQSLVIPTEFGTALQNIWFCNVEQNWTRVLHARETSTACIDIN